MPSPLRRLSVILPGLGLLAAAVFGAEVSAPQDTSDLQPAFASTCIGYCQHPTNAAKVFRWGVEDWRQEFEVGQLGSNWQSNHPDLVGQQNGMLTIEANPGTTQVRVWPDDQKATYGRWEARVRAVEYRPAANPFKFYWELVPSGGYTCGGNSIVLASYTPGDKKVIGGIHTLPANNFKLKKHLDLRSRAWHTYAVEVTPDHISWFIDTQVIRTERRPEALTGVQFMPRFRIEGDYGQTMTRSMMQMDWVRYYTLKRPNAMPITAPRSRWLTSTDVC